MLPAGLLYSFVIDAMNGGVNGARVAFCAAGALVCLAFIMNDILDQPIQTGANSLTNKGYDLVFDHVGFAYNTGETVLKDVSFTAKQGQVTALVGASGGERQRISIARAFLKNAPIILLDEATASLDVENETLIQAALSRLIKDKTVLVIAHRMRTVSGADKQDWSI